MTTGKGLPISSKQEQNLIALPTVRHVVTTVDPRPSCPSPRLTWGDRIVRSQLRQPKPTGRRPGRTAGRLLAGVLGAGGALLLAAGPAAAAPTTQAVPAAGPNTVIFKGGCYLAGVGYSDAKPSVNNQDDLEAMTVPAGTRLALVNNLGSNATLTIAGQTAGQVASGSYANYTAPASGPVSVSMTPACLLGPLGVRNYKPEMVSVTPASNGGTSAPPSNGGGATGPTGGAGHTGGAPTNGTGTQGGAPAGGQTGQPPASQPAAGIRPALPLHQPAARGAVPPGAAAPGAGSGTSGGGAASGTTRPQVVNRPADAQPVGNASPTGTTSLLALIAAVCLVGVGAAAVRTVLTQRGGGRAATT